MIDKLDEIMEKHLKGVPHKDVDNAIVGFVLKNDKGLVLLGDNTSNEKSRISENDNIKGYAGELSEVFKS